MATPTKAAAPAAVPPPLSTAGSNKAAAPIPTMVSGPSSGAANPLSAAIAPAAGAAAAAGGARPANGRLFNLPALFDNPNGWGPPPTAQTPLTLQLSAVPFAPFNKNDRLGRVSDWTASAMQRRYIPQSRGPALQASVAAASTPAAPGGPALKDEEEGSFSTVDGRAKKQPKVFGQRPRGMPNRRMMTDRGRGRGGFGDRGRGGRGGRGGRAAWSSPQDREIVRESAVEVGADWKLIQEIELADWAKVILNLPPVKELTGAGSLESYDTNFDKIFPKSAKSLTKSETKQHFAYTTSDDPIMLRLMKDKVGNVFGTDTILAVLMASPKSVVSWDIVVKKENGVIVFDKRPESKIDFLTVNENWNEPDRSDRESINHPSNLSTEATFIAQCFSQQVLEPCEDDEERLDLGEPLPFADRLVKGMTPASVGYRYRAFTLADDIKVVARAEVNAYITRKGEPQLLAVKTLNEFDSKVSGNVDWRQKLETQSGAVLAVEMKNNANRLMKYVAQTAMSGVNEVKLGFVSRIHPKDSFRHSILMTQRYAPAATFAQTLGVDVRVMWGTLRTIIQTLMKLEDGKYLLLKDPTKPSVSLYRIPPALFDKIGAGVNAAAAPAPRPAAEDDGEPAEGEGEEGGEGEGEGEGEDVEEGRKQ